MVRKPYTYYEYRSSVLLDALRRWLATEPLRAYRRLQWQAPAFSTSRYGSPALREFSTRCEESTSVQLPVAACGKPGSRGDFVSDPAAIIDGPSRQHNCTVIPCARIGDIQLAQWKRFRAVPAVTGFNAADRQTEPGRSTIAGGSSLQTVSTKRRVKSTLPRSFRWSLSLKLV